MADFEYGPVEIYTIGFPGRTPSPETMAAIGELVDAGDIRLLDAVIVSRLENGDVEAVELEDLGDEIDVTGISLEAGGLVGDEDFAELADSIPVGSSAAVVAIELLFAKKLASRFAESGAQVLSTERIPAPVVNEVLAAASSEED